ncbi:MAG: DUF885 domain-containing protein [Gemmatimonadota bacterium]|nr:DUF885 domain-containing protein [Gemmatimonadota bacterium]
MVFILARVSVQINSRRALFHIARAVGYVPMLLIATQSLPAQHGLSSAADYALIINRLAGAPTDLDSLYSEAIRRRLALDSIIEADGSALFGAKLSSFAVRQRIRTDPELVMHDPDSIVLAYANGLDRARGMLPRLFDTVTDGPITVRSIPAEEAASSAPAAYVPADPKYRADSAVFLVNAHQPGGIARMNILLGVAHEAYPGHHFQARYALAHGTSPEATPDNEAYIEGWGIYSERLADEAGLYDGDRVARLGYLIHLYDVFMALQIDIGIHARGWTRAAAVDTMMMVAGRPRSQAASYANRDAASPGQLATYGIGFTSIVRERERAESALGTDFDLARFHAIVLSDGSSTLAALDNRVTHWIDRSTHGG